MKKALSGSGERFSKGKTAMRGLPDTVGERESRGDAGDSEEAAPSPEPLARPTLSPWGEGRVRGCGSAKGRTKTTRSTAQITMSSEMMAASAPETRRAPLWP